VRRLALLVALVAVVAACSRGDDEVAATSTSIPTTTTTTRPLPERYREQVASDVDVTRDVVYGNAPGLTGAPEDLKLDLYLPKDDDEVDRAAILFVHGGGFRSGDKSQGVSSILAPLFARLGYVTASINYRLLAPARCTGADTGDNGCSNATLNGIHDGQAAVRWMRANAAAHGVDPDRIGIAGESAGALVAFGAGVWSESPGESGTPGVASDVQAWMSLSGGLPGGLFATAGDAPGILFASVDDPIVPYQWSVDSRDNLDSAGVPVELVTYEGGVHVPFREHQADIETRTTDFFYEHLALAGE
jgi:acetyl esterase/lipase